ncbi:LPP20 family lipoprotein [Sulfurimonas sp.]
MNKLRIIFLILGIFLVGGCGSKQQVVVAKKALPSWVIHPPLSNSLELIALGEGENQQDAINNALSLIASTLHVSISSNFSAKTVVKEGSVNSSEATYINETQSNVAKIQISEYELLHVKRLGFKRYAALVKVNKQKLFQGLKNEIDQKFMIFDNDIKNLQNANALKQLAAYKKMKNSFGYIENALIVMKILKKNFDDTKYLAKLNKINAQYQYLLQHISFWVVSNMKSLDKPVVSALTQQKFIIKNVKSKMHFTIYIHVKIQKANAYGFTLARSEISFITKDYKGEVLASNVVHITGQSSQGYAIAKQNLVKRLNHLIQKEGISKVLNVRL